MFIADLHFYKNLSRKRSQVFAKYLAPLIPPGATILDFGCGNMYTALELLKVDPSWKITGVDVIRDQNLTDDVLADPRIEFKIADSNQLPFVDGSFDIVLALATMHHTFSPEYFLSELKRVTKPGGSILLVEEMYLHWLDKLYISSQDWVLNKLKHGVPVPLNFKSNKWYKNEFQKQGLRIDFEGSVRAFPTFMHHYVYKLRMD